VPRHVARLVTRLVAPLVVDYFAYVVRPGSSARRAARRRLLLVALLVINNFTSHRLVIDYFAYAARPGASARRAARRRPHWLRAPRFPLRTTLALLQPRRASRLLVSRQHWLYFEYVVRHHDVIFWSHRIDHSSRLVFQTSREWQSRPQQLVGINSD
jgi:hypothetical protein